MTPEAAAALEDRARSMHAVGDYRAAVEAYEAVTEGLADDVERRTVSRLRTAITEHETDDGVLFRSAARLITARQR